MFAFLDGRLPRRRLRPVVSMLPRRLKSGFGTSPSYTFLQAKRAISDLGFGEALEPYAYAAACKYEELQRANYPLSEHDYWRLRAELAERFYLNGLDFTMKDLLATPYARHSPAPENANASIWASWIARSWGGAWGVSGAGLSALWVDGHGSADGSGCSEGGGGGGGDGGGC
jgi:hypothetical protein